MDGALLMTLAVVGLTTLPPLVPNSALIAAAGALAAAGRIPLPLLLLTVAGSALAGDALMYGLGRRTGARLRRRLSRGRRRAALEWTQRRVDRYGVPFVIAVRFLPSGRIVGGLATGAVGYPVRRFLLGSGLAELLWAVYSVGVGYWGGRALAGTLSGALVGIGASAVLAGAAGVVQRLLRRRAPARPGPHRPALPPGPSRPPSRFGRLPLALPLLSPPSRFGGLPAPSPSGGLPVPSWSGGLSWSPSWSPLPLPPSGRLSVLSRSGRLSPPSPPDPLPAAPGPAPGPGCLSAANPADPGFGEHRYSRWR
ncbi:VTT domain-containing protein [Streptomyces sp. NPDC007083]|uniref:DedA family protein n=1 Tax=unclassified Streptomyces TaxID=2593676 RepID=UPI0033C1A5F1